MRKRKYLKNSKIALVKCLYSCNVRYERMEGKMKKVSLFVVALIIVMDLCGVSKVFAKEIFILNKMQPINRVIHLVHLDICKKGNAYNDK